MAVTASLWALLALLGSVQGGGWPSVIIERSDLAVRGTSISEETPWAYWDQHPEPGSVPTETVDAGRQLPTAWSGDGWFGVGVELVDEVSDGSLILWLTRSGKVEVFWDEQLVFRDAGHDGIIPADLQARIPIELSAERGRHRLLVHIEDPWAAANHRLTGFTGLSARVGHAPNGIAADLDYHVQHFRLHGWVSGFASLILLLQLFLVLFRPRRRGNLVAAVSILPVTGMLLLDEVAQRATSAGQIYLSNLATNLAVLASAAVLPQFFQHAAGRPVPPWMRVFQLLAIPLGLALHWTGFQLPYVYAAIALVICGHRIIRSQLDGTGDWILTVGGGLFALAAAAELLEAFGGIEAPTHSLMFGFAGLLLAMALHVARDFGRAEVESAREKLAREDAEARAAMVEELRYANQALRDTQARLVQSKKMASLGRLAAGLSHELNTPIGAIHSAAQTIRMGLERLPASDSPQRTTTLLSMVDAACRSVSEGTDRVSAIVQKLKDFARLDEAALQRMTVETSIEAALRMLEPSWPATVELHRDFQATPTITARPGDLNQLFYELLLNALHCQPEGGAVRVSTSMVEARIIVEIQDDGPGIPDDLRDRVFDPGVTTRGVGVGTGLGLSIAYRIVDDQGGHLTLVRRPGGGTSVTVYLPQEDSRRSNSS